MFRKMVFAFLVLLLAGCQGGQVLGKSITATQSPTPFPAVFAKTFKIGEYNMAIRCIGTGEPTIILENDLGYYPEGSAGSFANTTRPGNPYLFSRYGRTCQYIHAGTYNLREKVTGKRTAADLANDLHALLQEAGVPGPYIFITFGDASFITLMYTNQYPDEVVGIVCLACRAPAYEQILVAKLESSASSGEDEIKKAVESRKKWLAGNSEDLSSYEKMDRFASYQQVQKVTSLGDLPVVVLFYGGPRGDTISALNKMKYEAQVEAAEALVKLSTHSRMEILPGTNANTDLSGTSTVLKAVEEMAAGAKE